MRHNAAGQPCLSPAPNPANRRAPARRSAKQAAAPLPAIREAIQTAKARPYHSSKSAEWYTPPHILIAAARIMEGIEVDPCAAIRPESRAISGIECFTEHDDGLKQPWKGNVFLNPPYGRQKNGTTILNWMQKARHEVEIGNCPEIVILWKSATDTAAWREATAFTLKTCFVSGRLSFSGIKEPAPFPSAIFYYGADPEGFEIGFSEIGTVWTNPKPKEA